MGQWWYLIMEETTYPLFPFKPMNCHVSWACERFEEIYCHRFSQYQKDNITKNVHAPTHFSSYCSHDLTDCVYKIRTYLILYFLAPKLLISYQKERQFFLVLSDLKCSLYHWLPNFFLVGYLSLMFNVNKCSPLLYDTYLHLSTVFLQILLVI